MPASFETEGDVAGDIEMRKQCTFLEDETDRALLGRYVNATARDLATVNVDLTLL